MLGRWTTTSARTLLALAITVAALSVVTAPGSAATERPGAPPEPVSAADAGAPTVSVTPNTDLVDEQVVAVHGEGFADRGYLWYVECAAGGDDDTCRWSDADDDIVRSPGGGFTGTYQVDARYVTYTGETVDCRVAPGCALRVLSQHDDPVDVPISFDPSAPLAPPPVLTTTPASGLTDGDQVHLELTGFRPREYVYLYLCSGSSLDDLCAFGDHLLEPVTADGDGTMTADLILRAVNLSESAERFDCRVEDCHVIVTEDLRGNGTAAARVAFDPDAPLAPEPTITVTPSTGLADGQAVDVAVAGLFAGEHFSVVQCRVPTRTRGYYTCEPHGWTDLVAADTGRYATRMTVRDHFADEIGEENLDCRAVPCAIGLARMIDTDAVLEPRVLLTFAPLPAAAAADPVTTAPRFTG